MDNVGKAEPAVVLKTYPTSNGSYYCRNCGSDKLAIKKQLTNCVGVFRICDSLKEIAINSSQ